MLEVGGSIPSPPTKRYYAPWPLIEAVMTGWPVIKQFGIVRIAMLGAGDPSTSAWNMLLDGENYTEAWSLSAV
jgi:hypothetical protein